MANCPFWMSDPATEDEFREHWQRFLKPDGLCLQCRKPAADGPCGTITIKISETATDNGAWFTQEFCSWECLAHRFAGQAGGVFVVTCVNTAADLHNE
jgi:hypothetical protein